MSDWAAGYVTDIGYTQGFYRELTPSLLGFAPLAVGVGGPNASGPLAYCELACGQGFGLNLLAAANPHITFHGNDFNPAQIANARAFAAEAGTTNVHFSDASFAEYVDEPGLPQFDIVALHGIYSWVFEEHRAHIREFIRRHLKPGGLVFVSYNAMPGWSLAAPIRHLLHRHGSAGQGPTTARIKSAFAFVEQLKATGARALRPTGMTEWLESTQKHDPRYLAHEYMNGAWNPMYFSQVAAELSEVKLNFVVGAHLPEHLDNLTFNAEQQALVAGLNDPVMRETVRDYVQGQQFRRDVFMKGSVSLARLDLDDAWLNTRFALTTPRVEGDLKVKAIVGEVELRPEIYDLLLNKFEARPHTVRELVADPAIAALGWPVIRQALAVLTGFSRISPALDAAGDAKRAKRTAAFNAAVIRRAHSNGELAYLASPVTGGGVAVSRIEQLLLAARNAKAADPLAHVAGVLASGGERLLKDGQPIDDPAVARAELAAHAEGLNRRLPMLVQLGVA